MRPSQAPASNPAARPEPQRSFQAPGHMVPGLLTIWEFCHAHRAMLRLPPFPLSRLELAMTQPFSRPDDQQASGSGPGKQGIPDEHAVFLRDVHACMLRLAVGLQEEVLEAPTLAGYGAAAELAPHHAYRCACCAAHHTALL